MKELISLSGWLKVFIAYSHERGKRDFPKNESDHWNILYLAYKDMHPDSSVVLDDVRRTLAILNVRDDVLTEKCGGRITLKDPSMSLQWIELIKGRPEIERSLKDVFERIMETEFFLDPFKGMDKDKCP